MHPRRSAAAFLAAAVLLAALPGCIGGQDDGTLRLGYFPNITHAQALYGLETGLFAQRLGPEVKVRAVDFNAGPAAMEALLTGGVDVTYAGPSPTLNTLAATQDRIVVIMAGTASAGARFIVQPSLAGANASAFAGKTLATPQLGNTQDVSLKHWLLEHGLRSSDTGGNVQILNAQTPELLTLFQNKDIHGAWVPEPWATRLENEAGGVEYLDEADLWPGGQFVTTHLVTTKDYLARHPETIRRLLEAHVEATIAVRSGGADVLAAVNAGIERATGKRLGEDLLREAFPRVNFTYDPLQDTFYEFARMADRLGLLRGDIPPASKVYDLTFLNAALEERGLATVPQP